MTLTEDKIWHLEHFNVVKALPMKDRMRLNALAEMKEFKKSEEFYLLAANKEKIYFLKKGHIRLSKFTASGEEVLIEIIGPGEIFGRFIQDEVHMTDETAVGLTSGILCSLDTNIWDQFMKEHAHFSISVTKLVGLKIKRLQSHIRRLQFLPAADRINTVLQDLTQRYGRKIGLGYEQELKLHLTHQDIAKLSGTSRQTVTSHLNMLEKRGHINYDRKRILLKSEFLPQVQN
jgi:CRP-like cAMP-binding protein